MGLSGISIWQLLIILLIVTIIFGSKKLRGFGEDLGAAVGAFKKGINAQEEDKKTASNETISDATIKKDSINN